MIDLNKMRGGAKDISAAGGVVATNCTGEGGMSTRACTVTGPIINEKLNPSKSKISAISGSVLIRKTK